MTFLVSFAFLYLFRSVFVTRIARNTHMHSVQQRRKCRKYALQQSHGHPLISRPNFSQKASFIVLKRVQYWLFKDVLQPPLISEAYSTSYVIHGYLY